MLFLKQLVAFVAIFGAAIAACYAIPAVNAFDIDINGWGWLAYFGGIIGSFIGVGFISAKVDRALGVTAGTKSEFHTFVEESLEWFALPVGATIGWLIVPSAFVIVSPYGGWVLCGIIGIAMGLEKLVQRRIKAAHFARLAAKTDDTDKTDETK
ncbi:MAG: hypothetical protein K2W95_36470 [Candidatus Obscuribacterales bacterium]|nr:hypothetical protein [Candidatus Obscuribacterales bacterium]